MENEKKRGRGKRIVVIATVVLVIVFGGYAGALAWYAPDESKLTAWKYDLDKALSEAKESNRLVLVKAGSKW